MTLAGVIVKVVELHKVAFIAFIEGTGSTVIVTEKVGPVQVPDLGVTVYVAVCEVFEGLFRVTEILEAFVPAAPPVIPPVTAGAAQV